MTALAALIRALHFASLMAVFGASALLFQARDIGVCAAGWRKPSAVAAAVALVTAVLNLCFVSGEMAGDPATGFDGSVVANVVAHSFYGNVFFVRAVLLVVLCLLCLREGALGAKAVIAGAALAAIGLTSHAAAAGDPHYQHVRAAGDALHLLTAGFWFGGLVVLVPEVWPRPRDAARTVALLSLFSRWGVVSVAILLAAGTANAVAILDVQGMRWSGTYITLLAVKIVLAAVMVALALTNRFGVLPALARGEAEAAQTIPLTVIAELACAVAIVLIVGFLGLTAPMEM